MRAMLSRGTAAGAKIGRKSPAPAAGLCRFWGVVVEILGWRLRALLDPSSRDDGPHPQGRGDQEQRCRLGNAGGRFRETQRVVANVRVREDVVVIVVDEHYPRDVGQRVVG